MQEGPAGGQGRPGSPGTSMSLSRYGESSSSGGAVSGLGLGRAGPKGDPGPIPCQQPGAG